MSALTEFRNLAGEATSHLQSVDSPEALEQFRIAYLGRRGKITLLFENLKSLSLEERRQWGPELNQLKRTLEEEMTRKQATLSASGTQKDECFDPTLPGLRPPRGRVHPITQTIQEIARLFQFLGFEIVDGPEVETEFHNFTALNIPPDHPSRDSFATFYVDGDGGAGLPPPQGAGTAPLPSSHLLRSQTSTVQIRVMQKRKPPLRVIAPGRVYRPDRVDASHSFMFHQIEGLMVDDRATFGELKGIVQYFLRKLFGPKTKIRFRPHFFPFTEPSAEVDVSCFLCQAKGCGVCGGKGWLELLGAGSVDPAVFGQVGYDPKKVQGFAFGLGVERIAMLRHAVADIRLFYENDLRFLRQF